MKAKTKANTAAEGEEDEEDDEDDEDYEDEDDDPCERCDGIGTKGRPCPGCKKRRGQDLSAENKIAAWSSMMPPISLSHTACGLVQQGDQGPNKDE